jgi:Zn-dependent protease
MASNGFARPPGWRIFRAPVYAHWSVLVGGSLLFLASRAPLATALTAVVCYVAVIVLHEAGHAFFARRVGLRPISIHIAMMHGTCRYESPDADDGQFVEREDLIVAWGGGVAQLVVAIPLILLDAFTELRHVNPIGAVIGVLGYASVFIAAFNLLPGPGMDGEKAWKLLPRWWRERRERQAFARQRRQRP